MTLRLLPTALAVIGLSFSVGVSAALPNADAMRVSTQTESQNLTLSSEEENHRLTRLLAALYPDSQVRGVRRTPIANFFEVTLATSVAYVFVDPQALQKALAKTTLTDDEKHSFKITLFRYWYFGGVFFDMKTQKDLTLEAKNRAQRIDVASLPIEQAIERVQGTPKHTLYVFTDPLCPYCRKLEATLNQLNDVRIYTFLSPLVTLHPEAREVAARIWCAKEPVKAFKAVMLEGETLTTSSQCETPIFKNEALMRTLGIKGTPTLFLENGDRLTGAVDTQTLLKALDETNPAKANAKAQTKEDN